MAKKFFRDWRLEAAQLNANAENQGEEPPIPDYARLRLRPLARKVLQARLDQHQGGTNDD